MADSKKKPEMKVVEPIDALRDQIVDLIQKTNSDTEFVVVLRQSTGENTKVSSSIRCLNHFGMMHMISRATNAWEKVNIKEGTPTLQVVPPMPGDNQW